MKKLIAVFLAGLLLISCTVAASAKEPRDILISRTVEVLENGDSVVTELYENAIQPRTGKSGYKSYTHRNSGGTAIWKVTVTGTFTYNYGVSSTATGATATVNIYSGNAAFQSKNAWTSGNTAWASGTVVYDTVSTTRSVSISCDKYGNLY